MEQKDVGLAGSAEVGGEAVGKIETHGIDLIAPEDRYAPLRSLFFVFLGSQMSFAIIIIGAVPILLGLSFWASISAITVGLFLGSIVFAPICMLGVRTGTNGPVSSGAFFG